MCLVEKLALFSCLDGKLSKKGSVGNKQACDQAVIKILPDFQEIFQLLTSPETTSNYLFSNVQLFVTPWTATHQASLFFTISQSLLKLMSIELVLPSNHLILCRPLLPFAFNRKRSMSRLYIVTVLIKLTCRVYYAKWQAG